MKSDPIVMTFLRKFPGNEIQSDAQIEKFFSNERGIVYPVGTKMGVEDDCVVD
ncbi:MAG: hypothetical protein CM15mP111_4410 [Hyphomicrobiales bacterium]|nr:MAG: hypothetical protein CM15mP111_4410 [Hyphomicrobiales bacterium]